MYSKESMECLMKLANLILQIDLGLSDCKYIDTSVYKFPNEYEFQKRIDRMYHCVRIYEKNVLSYYKTYKDKADKEKANTED